MKTIAASTFRARSSGGHGAGPRSSRFDSVRQAHRAVRCSTLGPVADDEA
jgi:hypothetical protein